MSTKKEKKRNFDMEASSWDDNLVRVKLANDIFKSLSDRVALLPSMDVLDFGCGTGLISVQMQPLVHSVTGIDSSKGMLDVFREKIKKQHLERIKACYFDLGRGGHVKGRYHLALASMTLHHIKDIKSLISQLYRVLTPLGYICLADLDLDDGKFHDSLEGVFHHGFDREDLKGLLRKAGFVDVGDYQAAEVTKLGSDGIARTFSVFLIIGRRQAKASKGS